MNGGAQLKKTFTVIISILLSFQLVVTSISGYWANSVVLDAPDPVDTNLTLTVGEWLDATYTVTFISNGGSVVSPLTVTHGDTFEIPYPTRSGYLFAGWFKESSLTNAWTYGMEVTQTITLYAKWNTVPANQYVVNFETYGGSTVAPQTVTNNNKVIRPNDPVREGYSFVGWYKESSYINSWRFESDLVTSTTTLHARWMTLQQAVELIQGALDYNPTYNHDYSTGNIVYETSSTGLGFYYIKTVNTAYGHKPGDGKNTWLQASALLDYVSGTTYPTGSLVYYNNFIYIATTQTNSVPGGAGWQVKTFNQYDVIVYQDLPYFAISSTGLRPMLRDSGWLLITSSWFNQ